MEKVSDKYFVYDMANREFVEVAGVPVIIYAWAAVPAVPAAPHPPSPFQAGKSWSGLSIPPPWVFDASPPRE